MSIIKNYIMVDDDAFSNVLSDIVLKNTLGEVKTDAFTIPEEALSFMQNLEINNLKPTILLLDINMPTLSGWEFMEEFRTFREEIQKLITVYILSSSVDERDIDKAKSNNLIKDIISKPLEPETILAIAGS